MIVGKRIFIAAIFLSACFAGLFGQSDSGNNKLQLSLHTNFGAVVNLSKGNGSVIYAPATLSQYVGLLANGKYGNFCLETGLQRFTYPVSMAARDTATQSAIIASFNNVYTAYRRIPLSIGYHIALKNSHFAVEPYLSGGWCFRNSDYSHLSTGSTGSTIGEGDSIIYTFTYGHERTQRSIFDAGVGAKLKFSYRAFTASFNVQYFQTLGAWGTLYGVYDRSSSSHGVLNVRESFRSPDRNLIFGVTAGMYLLR